MVSTKSQVEEEAVFSEQRRPWPKSSLSAQVAHYIYL